MLVDRRRIVKVLIARYLYIITIISHGSDFGDSPVDTDAAGRQKHKYTYVHIHTHTYDIAIYLIKFHPLTADMTVRPANKFTYLVRYHSVSNLFVVFAAVILVDIRIAYVYDPLHSIT